MRLFDGFLRGPTGSVVADTPAQFDDILGLYDQLAIEVTARHASPYTGLGVQIFHSADGRNWLPKQFWPEVSGTTLATQGTTLQFGVDDGTVPSLAFVKLRLTLGGTSGPVSAWVTLDVTASDLHADGPAQGSAGVGADGEPTIPGGTNPEAPP